MDISAAMIEIAQQRVPQAEFQLGSLFQVSIPPCRAVVVIGECINYLFDHNNNQQTLEQFFRRVYNALFPGGLFIFDVLEPEQVSLETTVKSFIEGEGWLVLVEKSEDDQHILTRRIITFRQTGALYRRDQEVHQQKLYDPLNLASMLCQIGFQVEVTKGYENYNLPGKRAVLTAVKCSLT
ncbi:MAG: class I SAM-dependent methyltransferase [Microcoleaceae cyanobacterium]